MYVNLFGGPGSGKSTTALGVAYEMKKAGLRVELIPEFAKSMVWQDRTDVLEKEPWYVHAKQLHYLKSVEDKVDWIITDSPSLLAAAYTGDLALQSFIYQEFKKASAINFLVRRVKPYQAYGRTQSEEEARALDVKIKNLLEWHRIGYWPVAGDDMAVQTILHRLGIL